MAIKAEAEWEKKGDFPPNQIIQSEKQTLNAILLAITDEPDLFEYINFININGVH